MSSNWSRPFQLTYPLTSRQVEEIDSMFQKLFSKLPLNVNRGGTGLGFDDLAIGDLIYGDEDADADPIFTTLASVSVGSYLRSGGILTAPLWSTVKLPNTAAVGDIWHAATLDTITGLAIGASGKIIRSNGTIPAYTAFTIPNTFSQGDIIYASALDTLLALAKDTNATRYLSNKGASNAPTWSQITLANGVTGVLDETNGGTGVASVSTGDLLYGFSANTWSTLAIGTGSGGSFLRNNAGVTVHWSTLVLPNAAAQGDTFISTASNVMTVLAKNTTATRYLSNTGASNNPAWAQVDLTNGVTGVLPVANGGTGVSNATQTFTPTLTNVANLTASTAYECQYYRVGNVVTVSGKVDVDPTLTVTTTQLGIALPIASDIGATEDCAGTAFAPAIAGMGAAILGDVTNNRAQMEWVSSDVTNQPMYFIFSYQVI